jgi:superfamily I DNA/RNA helicase
VSSAGAAALDALATILRGFDEKSRPWEVLARVLLDRTRIVTRLASSDAIADRTRALALWQMMNFVRAQPSAQGLPIGRLLDRVRRLVRLGDDRDLRQLPLAAQSIDAVRLMTMHGAKGLEFPVVHVPGLNQDTLPGSPQIGPCPPPDRMVEGEVGGAIEAWRVGQLEERECLFYVALSRARDRAFIYAPTRKANGHNRPLSPFLDHLGGDVMRRHITPARALPPPVDAREIDLDVEGPLRFSDGQLSLYQGSPRRFYNTH